MFYLDNQLISQKILLMQTVKGSLCYKLNNYEIEIKPISEKRFAITVIDPLLKVQFAQKDLHLQIIGVSTLTTALEGKNKLIKVASNYKHDGEVLQLKVSVQSAFLKSFEETIFIKKFRDVSENQLMTSKIASFSKQLKNIKEKDGNQMGLLMNFNKGQKSFNSNAGSTFDSLCEIQLPKGKHLLTFSFLLKATNQWMYMFIGNAGVIMANNGFYVPSAGFFAPYEVRHVYTVNGQTEKVSFTTYYTTSYPVILKNSIITAKKIE